MKLVSMEAHEAEVYRRESKGYPPNLIWKWNILKLYRGREYYPEAYRRDELRREIRYRLKFRNEPKGRGNAAKRRIKALYNDPNYIVWPDYAIRGGL